MACTQFLMFFAGNTCLLTLSAMSHGRLYFGNLTPTITSRWNVLNCGDVKQRFESRAKFEQHRKQDVEKSRHDLRHVLAGLRWPALQEHHFNKHGLPQGGPAPLFHSNDSTIPLPFLLGRHCDARDFATQGTCRDVGLKKRWSTKCNIEKYQKSQRNDGIKTYIMIKFLIIVYHLTNTASEKPTRCKTSIAETNNSLEMLRIVDDNVAKKCLPASKVDIDRNLSLEVLHKSNKSENNRPDRNQGT